MGTVVGNIGSTTTATVTNTSSTNNGLELNFGSGVHIVRVPGNVTLSGGNTIGKPGLTLSGTGKAIVLQEGGTITGGPGNTSNNYGGSGGQGATALVSNINTKVIKTYGNIIGGSGGGGGPGKGSIERSVITPKYFTFPYINPNSAYYAYFSSNNTNLTFYIPWGGSHINAWNNFRTNVASSTLNWSYVNNNNYISNGGIVAPIHGNDGNKGTSRSPGQTGNSGNSGNNGTPGNGNDPVVLIYFGYSFSQYSSGSSTSNSTTNTIYTSSLIRLNSSQLGILYNKYTRITYNSGNYVSYNDSHKVTNNPAGSPNYYTINLNNVVYNSKVNPTSGGSGGNPGNAYNTTNVTTPFG